MESGVHYFSRSNFYLIYGNATELYKPPLHSIVATISNIVITFIHVLHGILFDDLMTSIKNKLFAKSCFRQFKSCQTVIQTDSWIDESAKCHILIIPRNEFLQDKAIVHQSRLLDHLVAGDMILALNPAHHSTWCTCRHSTIPEQWNVHRK